VNSPGRLIVTPAPPRGRYGEFGGSFVPETVVPALQELEAAAVEALSDPLFLDDFYMLEAGYAGRPTPLHHARRLSERAGRAVWLKREDLLHTGAHKLNNALGQLLLAQRMGKHRIVAETGAGQHGLATATACALLGMECTVYMGREDMRRQAVNVAKMKLLGARVEPVGDPAATLKDATSEAIRDWVTNVRDTHYVIGSVVGPHPYPWLVRTLQSVIGSEARAQMLEFTGRLPEVVVASVGGGSNAIGIFAAFLEDAGVQLLGVEAGGRGPEPGDHGASLGLGSPGVLHGSRSYILQDPDGQVLPTHSISAGLDYPGVGPEHANLMATGRARYLALDDRQAVDAFHLLTRLEGIIPALESSHAVAAALRLPDGEGPILVCLSGRGDKDLETVLGGEPG
jgi:tryptophan synthase beta chain